MIDMNGITIDGESTGNVLSYGIYGQNAPIKVDNSILNAHSGNALNGRKGTSAGIFGYLMNIENGSTVDVRSEDVVTQGQGYSYGMNVYELTIEDSKVTAHSGDATGISVMYSVGIHVINEEGKMSITRSEISAYGGNTDSDESTSVSAGLLCYGHTIIDKSTIDAYGSAAMGTEMSYSAGIICFMGFTVENKSNIYCESGKCGGYKTHASGLICNKIMDDGSIPTGGTVNVDDSKITALGGGSVNYKSRGNAFCCGIFGYEANAVNISNNSALIPEFYCYYTM